MNTATQPELLPEAESDWISALSDEACRLNDAAVEAYGAGRVDEVEELFRRSIALFEQVKGPVHPDVAAALGNLGAVLEDRCDYLYPSQRNVTLRLSEPLGAPEEGRVEGEMGRQGVKETRSQDHFPPCLPISPSPSLPFSPSTCLTPSPSLRPSFSNAVALRFENVSFASLTVDLG